jgi:Predicted secreted protein
MPKILRSLTGLLAAIALALGALSLTAPMAHAGGQAGGQAGEQAQHDDVTLVVTELPAQVRLIPGEKIELTLVTNRTTGFTWTATKSGKKKAIKVSKGRYTAPDTDLVGAPGETTWTITARKRGTATVTISATPPGGGDPETSELTVIVMKG